MFKTFEVRQVANGYLVTMPPDMTMGKYFSSADVHVFPTWTDASKWLRDQFEVDQGADKRWAS